MRRSPSARNIAERGRSTTSCRKRPGSCSTFCGGSTTLVLPGGRGRPRRVEGGFLSTRVASATHVAAGTAARGQHGHMGMFGDYLEREGHGKLLQWQHASSGAVKNIVVPVRDQRTIKVPDAEAPQEPKSPRARQSPST